MALGTRRCGDNYQVWRIDPTKSSYPIVPGKLAPVPAGSEFFNGGTPEAVERTYGRCAVTGVPFHEGLVKVFSLK